ncbi:MAG: hypothetical protein HY257_05560 [Chloroflexi bacterium]|nr:hypothetical protein [Chloroflexota bacterium]
MSADTSVPNPVHIVFEDQAELVGYNLPQKSVAPNSELPITLYWRALAPMYEDFSVYIHLYDARGKQIGQWDAYPGNGLFPTRLWLIPRAISFVQPNPPPPPPEIIVDNYRVPIAADAVGPSVGRVEVGLYRKATLQNLIARDPQGRVITPTIARVKIAGDARVQIENPLAVSFGDAIVLAGYSLPQSIGAGARLELKLYWRARAVSADDYTVFVHLVDANGNLIAQKDSEPQNGAYPTSLWEAGETIADAYEIAIPRDAPTELQVRVGLYRAADGSRVFTREGDSVLVGTVRVTR